MEFRQLRYALAVAEERHFTRAAQRLHVAQSALSHQVAALESELGARLFDRTSRRVTLTPAGEDFVLHAREVLAATERLRAGVASTTDTVAGVLRIGTISTLTQLDLPALVREYRDRHPGVSVQLVPAMSEAIAAQVDSGDLDLGFIGLWHTRPQAGLDAVALGTERLTAVVPDEHPWSGRARITLLDLATEPSIDFPAGTGARRQSDDAFTAAGLPRRVVAEAGSADLVAELTRAGVGIGILPESYARGSGLRLLPIADAPIRTVHLVTNPRLLTPIARAFVDLACLHLTDPESS
ncbi:LysR family transcriptional regulator [Rhodococcus sp. NPDC003348]